jgi:hypothetical protein
LTIASTAFDGLALLKQIGIFSSEDGSDIFLHIIGNQLQENEASQS